MPDTPVTPDKKSQLFSAAAQVNPPTPHLPAQPQPANPTPDAPTQNKPQGEYVLPWTKVSNSGNTTQSSVANEAFLPNSSMAGSTRTTNTTGGQILSIGKPKKWGILIPLLLILVMLISPIAFLTYGSYHNWNLPVQIPLQVKAITDETIMNIPFAPKTSAQIIRVVLINTAQQKTLSHQLLISSLQESTNNHLDLNISGKTLLEDFYKTELKATGKFIDSQNTESSITIDFHTSQNAHYLKINQPTPLSYIDFSMIPDQWIKIPTATPVHTAGKQALTAIRNKKLSELFTQASADLVNKTTLVEEDQISVTHYILTTQISPEQITKLIEEYISIYTETQSEQIIDELTFSLWKTEMTNFFSDPITVRALINKNSLLVENVTIETLIQPEKNPQQGTLLANLDRDKLLYTTKLNYTATFSEAVTILSPTPIHLIESRQIPWTGVLKHPTLQPITRWLVYVSQQ